MSEPKGPEQQSPDKPAETNASSVKSYLKHLLKEIVRQKRWALMPVWLLLAIVGLILVLTGNAHLLPAIYLAL